MLIAPLLIDELISLPPMRVQGIYGYFNTIVVIELYAPQTGRLYLVYDQAKESPTLHVQRENIKGQKTNSPLILMIKKHALGCPLWFTHIEGALKAIVLTPENTLILSFNAISGITLSTEAVLSYKTPNAGIIELINNFSHAVSYIKLLHQRIGNFIYKEQKKILEKALKKKMALLKNLNSDLKKAHALIAQEDDAKLLSAHLHLIKKGMKNIELMDYAQDPPIKRSLIIDEVLAPAHFVSEMFKKIKRAKRGLGHIVPRQEQIVDEIAEIKKKLLALHSLDLNAFIPSSPTMVHGKKKSAPARLPYRIYSSSDGIAIWVGKSAKDNDDLSLHHAKGNEWWFHIREGTGSHVIVKSSADFLPEATFIEAGMLAAHFSAQKNEASPEVMYTRVKNLRKPKGLGPGKLLVAQEKSRIIRMEAKLLALLLDSTR